MKKKHSKILLGLILINTFFAAPVETQAQILPKTELSTQDCIENFASSPNMKKILESGKATKEQRDNLLGCAIKTGNISLWMIPFYMTYLINFILAVSGLISVLFIVIGGYWYIIGSAQGQTDKGKNTILYAIVGLVVSLMAWIIVNVVQTLVT